MLLLIQLLLGLEDAPRPTFPYSAQPVCGLPGQQMGDDVGLRVRLVAEAAALGRPVRRGMAGTRVAYPRMPHT